MNKNPSPPRKALNFLLGFMDLEEQENFTEFVDSVYKELLLTKGQGTARIWFWSQFIRSLPQLAKKYIEGNIVMIKNYLKIAWRNLNRYKGYSFIHISGLTVGMAAFILIALFVQYELSFDKFHENEDRIFRVVQQNVEPVNMETVQFASTQYPLASLLISEYPEVISATKFRRWEDTFLNYNDNSMYENGIAADDRFFEVFTFPFINGDKNTALLESFSLVLSQKTARKLFNDEDPIGKYVALTDRRGREYDTRITGVIKDIPPTSHFQFDFILSISTFEAIGERYNSWTHRNYYTYLKVQEGCLYKELEKKLTLITQIHEQESRLQDVIYSLQPLKSIHLKSHLKSEVSQNNDIRRIYLMISIGFIILCLACINYINLSTAQATKRSKEIFIRKVTGARRNQLISQFLGESFCFTAISLLAALIIVILFLPFLSSSVDRNIDMSNIQIHNFFLILIGIVLFVGIASGSYPALFLSKARLASVSKDSAKMNPKGVNIRNILVILQFCISIILIFSILLINKQLQYIKNSELGFNKEHIVVVPFKNPVESSGIQKIKNDLRQYPGITNVTFSSYLPTNYSNWTIVSLEGEDGEDKELKIHYTDVDYDFLDVFDIELVAGRNFSKEYTSDVERAIILNETAVKTMGWREPIGKSFRWWQREGMVIGVIKDIHFMSFRQKIEPMALIMELEKKKYLSIKIESPNIQSVMNYIKSSYKKFNVGYPFEYFFLDDKYNLMYKSEEKLENLITYFSILAIYIASLGLVGLMFFSVDRKRKEIGIRKVLGASVSGIVAMLSKDFIKLVSIASIIAWPIAYYIMDKWLQDFVYKTEMGVSEFVLSSLVALFIAIISVGYQSIKAATANPVDSLRYE